MDRFTWIKEHSTGKIVDIGGNDGHTFGEDPNVTVVDIDKYDIPNFVRADASNLPFKDKEFDTAVLAEILEHVPDPVKVMKEARRVASKVIMTIPNEYKWDERCRPFNPLEKEMERTGKTAKELAVNGNARCTEFYTEDGYEHLYHVRFYDEKTLRADLKKAGYDKFTLEELEYGGFYWFAIVSS